MTSGGRCAYTHCVQGSVAGLCREGTEDAGARHSRAPRCVRKERGSREPSDAYLGVRPGSASDLAHRQVLVRQPARDAPRAAIVAARVHQGSQARPDHPVALVVAHRRALGDRGSGAARRGGGVVRVSPERLRREARGLAARPGRRPRIRRRTSDLGGRLPLDLGGGQRRTVAARDIRGDRRGRLVGCDPHRPLPRHPGWVPQARRGLAAERRRSHSWSGPRSARGPGDISLSADPGVAGPELDVRDPPPPSRRRLGPLPERSAVPQGRGAAFLDSDERHEPPGGAGAHRRVPRRRGRRLPGSPGHRSGRAHRRIELVHRREDRPERGIRGDRERPMDDAPCHGTRDPATACRLPAGMAAVRDRVPPSERRIGARRATTRREVRPHDPVRQRRHPAGGQRSADRGGQRCGGGPLRVLA